MHLVSFFLCMLGLFCVCTDDFAGAYAKFVASEVGEILWEFVYLHSSMLF